jgi:uncharacterized protein YhjY with autotransporter beta-barrel domain
MAQTGLECVGLRAGQWYLAILLVVVGFGEFCFLEFLAESFSEIFGKEVNMNRIYSLVWSVARGGLTVASETAKSKACNGGRGAGVEKSSSGQFSPQPYPLKTLVMALLCGLSTASAVAESFSTDWNSGTGNTPSNSGNPVTIAGTLGSASVTVNSAAYINSGGLFQSNWASILPSNYLPVTDTPTKAVALGYTSTATTQTIAFSQSVVNPILMFNYVDLSRFDFSTLGTVSLLSTAGSVVGTMSNNVLTITQRGIGEATDGFSVQLTGSYSTNNSFTIQTLSGANPNESVGFGLAVLGSLPTVSIEPRPSAADTHASIQAMGVDLNKVYNAQYGIAQQGLSYDCKLFDENNLCLSTGARVTQNRADGSAYDGVALIAAYRAQPHVRLGAWIDQNESRKMAANVTADNSTPMVGAFAVWNENLKTGEGLEVKVSAAYGQKGLTLTRPVLGTSERGQGSSKLSTLVAEASVGYGIQLDSRTRVSPFAGLRYAKLSNAGYAEKADIFSPLTFAKTSQSTTSVIAGVNLHDKPEGPIGLDLSAGVERYVSSSAAQLSATGIDGLSATQMTPVLSKNRLFASAALNYDLAKNQQLQFGLSHSKQFAASDWMTSASVRYVIGL